MKSCRSMEKRMAEALSGGLTDRERSELETHVAGCRECARAYQEYRSMLGTMRQRKQAEPDDRFMNEFWARLSPELEPSPKKHVRFRLLLNPRFALPLTAAVCLFAGIWIGRSQGPVEVQTAVRSETGKKGKGMPVEMRTAQVLERSQRILLAFSNFDAQTDDPAVLNLPVQKQTARSLIRETGLLKADLPGDADRKLQMLLSDLELILLQIANIEETVDMDNIEIIRDGLDKRSILFKIQMNTLDRSNRDIPGPASQHI
ncbi:zf-HC2 domain-containing protein [bacterium]|nr:zf-HC2 domain-containing protein [bacterium]